MGAHSSKVTRKETGIPQHSKLHQCVAISQL